MKIPTPSFKKIRIVVVIILFLIFFFLIGLVKNSFAIQGYKTSDGKCYAYKWTKGNQTRAAHSLDYYQFLFSNTDGRLNWGSGSHIPQGSHCQINISYYGTFQTFQWDAVAKTWTILAPNNYSLGVREIVNQACTAIADQPVEQAFPEYGKFLQFFQSRQIPENQSPDQYWPQGPPGDCGLPCETQRAAKISECGGENKVDWSSWNDNTCSGGECIVPCKDEKQALIDQCQGMVNVDWSTFSEETCIGGKCKCTTAQLDAIKGKCGGSEKVDWENFSYQSCTGECLPEECTEEQLDLKVKQILECDGIRYNWNPNTCTGECEELEPCADKIKQFEASCQNKGYWLKATGTAEIPQCEGQCKPNCFEKYEKLASYCSPKSVGWWDDETCLGGCDKCGNKAKECEETCKNRNGVADHDCAMTSSGQLVNTCLCVSDVPKPGQGPVNNPDEEDGLDPLAKTDPEIPQDTTPSVDPQSNPEDPNAELLEWQKAIKHNNDKLIEQNNRLREEMIKTVNNLDNLADNTIRSVDNQNANLGVLKNLAENMKINVENTKSIADQLADGKASDGQKLDKLGDKLDQINSNLEGLKAGGGSGAGDTPGGTGSGGVGDPNGELDEAEDSTGATDGDGNGLVDGTEKPAYTTPEHNFSDRTQQFVDSMQGTGL